MVAHADTQLHGTLTPWDVEGMYAQAHTILEDKTIQNVSGVPAMLEACARTGHVAAQKLLLDVYEGKFKGLPAAPQKAHELAHKLATTAAKPDDMADMQHMRQEAAFRYALYCERGYGCTKNRALAYKWMEKLASAGMSRANVELARFLIKYTRSKQAQAKALQLLKKQLRLAPNTPNLYFYLGHMCYNGYGMRRPNRLMALRFFEMGAAIDDHNAINNLATMYEQGVVVSEDRATAIKLYKRAADLGNKEASANMQRLAFKTNIETAISSNSPSRRICNAFLRLIDELPIAQRFKARLALPFTPKKSTFSSAKS